ncbi:uncharacterized protein LOC127265448 [Andrographis paniculata]|uniref:uncharacterized protein LOC127265448 n=1 Tax=Andrographis paniculata TaxID=175694 RepID=UPI0021E7DA44|nr:uncharacterized protein LOC127265448 [Andrographis paniculata]
MGGSGSGSSCLSIVSLAGAFLRRSVAAAGLSSHTVAIDDDTTIHFWGPAVSATSSNSNSKPNLVLIHGFGPESIWQWRHQMCFFAPFYNVYAPDLLFFGDSYTKSPERSELFQAACLVKLFDKLGLRRYWVVGTSYGGFVAYWMASMWSERVEKVVIASSAVNMVATDNADLLKKAQAEKIEDLLLPTTGRRLRTMLAFALYKRPPVYIPAFFLDDFIDKLYSENRAEKLQLLKGLSVGKSDHPLPLSPLSQQVLIVWGEHDRIFPLERARQLQKLLGESTQLEVMEKTSHVPQLEDPHKFNFILRSFFLQPQLQ